MRVRLHVALALLAFWAGQVHAGTGDILSRTAVTSTLSYSDWLSRAYGGPSDDPRDRTPDMDRVRSYYTKPLYDAFFARSDTAADQLIYESDSLKIAGFAVYPVHPEQRLPVILWCRGGEEQNSAVRLGDLLIMSRWAARGFVVLATQYRGGPRSDGRDEFGGDDVHDVEALAKVAAHLNIAYTNRLYLYGYSRGGMMAYRAIADGLKVRAAVVNSGIATLDEPARRDLLPIYRALMPDYTAEAANHFCRRSAICWPDKLGVPLLILHGTDDWRVPVRQAQSLQRVLVARGLPSRLHIYPRGQHVILNEDQGAIDDEILAFFAAH